MPVGIVVSAYGGARLRTFMSEESLREAAEDPQVALGAPYSTPVRRLDEVAAAKRPVIRDTLS